MQTFASRVDAGLVALALVVPVSMLVAALSLPFSAPGPTGWIVSGFIWLISGLTAAAIYFTLWPCGYGLDDDYLDIRCGVFHRRIAYLQIHGLRTSRTLWVAPALSWRRVRVMHAHGAIDISPQDPAAFAAALRERVEAAGGELAVML